LVLILPTSQSSQEAAAMPLYAPAGQLEHLSALSTLNLPGSHSVQLNAVVLEYDPASQSSQDGNPDPLNVPAVQSEHDVAASLLNLPATHGVHEVLPSSLNVPG
jgi:hypothetical protein